LLKARSARALSVAHGVGPVAFAQFKEFMDNATTIDGLFEKFIGALCAVAAVCCPLRYHLATSNTNRPLIRVWFAEGLRTIVNASSVYIGKVEQPVATVSSCCSNLVPLGSRIWLR
jgi:hypothetical protein